jgi:hypothetical protein
VLATPRCLEWQHDSNPTISTNNDPPDSLAPCRRPDSGHSSDHRSPRLPVAEFLVFLGRTTVVFLGRTTVVFLGRTTLVFLGRTTLESSAQ